MCYSLKLRLKLFLYTTNFLLSHSLKAFLNFFSKLCYHNFNFDCRSPEIDINPVMSKEDWLLVLTVSNNLNFGVNNFNRQNWFGKKLVWKMKLGIPTDQNNTKVWPNEFLAVCVNVLNLGSFINDVTVSEESSILC